MICTAVLYYSHLILLLQMSPFSAQVGLCVTGFVHTLTLFLSPSVHEVRYIAHCTTDGNSEGADKAGNDYPNSALRPLYFCFNWLVFSLG